MSGSHIEYIYDPIVFLHSSFSVLFVEMRGFSKHECEEFYRHIFVIFYHFVACVRVYIVYLFLSFRSFCFERVQAKNSRCIKESDGQLSGERASNGEQFPFSLVSMIASINQHSLFAKCFSFTHLLNSKSYKHTTIAPFLVHSTSGARVSSHILAQSAANKRNHARVGVGSSQTPFMFSYIFFFFFACVCRVFALFMYHNRLSHWIAHFNSQRDRTFPSPCFSFFE